MPPYKHYVVSGDTIWALARKCEVSEADILAANPQVDDPKNLQVGSLLIIPGCKAIPISDGLQKIDVRYDLEGKQDVHFPLQDPQNGKKITDNFQKCESSIKEPPKRKTGKFRISMFFDGTGNNRDNTKLGEGAVNLERLKDRIYPLYGKGKFDEIESFSNDYSNIARLEELICQEQPQYDFSASIYIEGIGTKDNEGIHFIYGEKGTPLVKDGVTSGLEYMSKSEKLWMNESEGFERERKIEKFKDDSEGMTKGQGKTGIKAKSRKGVSEIIEKIIDNIKSFDSIELDVDVFGFSRGAAAARYFIYLIKGEAKNTLIHMLSANSVVVDTFNINFVGLFDTVPAYGSGTRLFDWTKDVEELQQGVFHNIDVVGKVVHLCAAEEYRDAFKLVNIKSAVEKGYGIEIFLPGAHSDVGGSYKNNSSEGYDKKGKKDYKYQILDLDNWYENEMAKMLTGVLTKADIVKLDKDRLISLGWYKESEFKGWKIGDALEAFCLELGVRRNNIKNTYTYIPLDVMYRFAQESGGIKFKKNDYLNRISGDKTLEAVKKHVDDYVSTYCTRNDSECWHWERLEDELYKELRHGYLHMSAHYDVKEMNFLAPSLRSMNTKEEVDKIKKYGIRQRDNLPDVH